MEQVERGLERIFIYIVPLPAGVREMVTPCLEGYTVYLNESLDDGGLIEAYEHAMKHIDRRDFERSGDVQTIEAEAHAG